MTIADWRDPPAVWPWIRTVRHIDGGDGFALDSREAMTEEAKADLDDACRQVRDVVVKHDLSARRVQIGPLVNLMPDATTT